MTNYKTLKYPQNQSLSIYFSKISWGDMPPDPPSISMLHMLIVLCTITQIHDCILYIHKEKLTHMHTPSSLTVHGPYPLESGSSGPADIHTYHETKNCLMTCM